MKKVTQNTSSDDDKSPEVVSSVYMQEMLTKPLVYMLSFKHQQ